MKKMLMVLFCFFLLGPALQVSELKASHSASPQAVVSTVDGQSVNGKGKEPANSSAVQSNQNGTCNKKKEKLHKSHKQTPTLTFRFRLDITVYLQSIPRTGRLSNASAGPQ